MLVVPQDDVAVADRRLVATRLLDEPGRTAGEIMHELRLPLGDLIEVDHVHVGPLAGLQHAAVVQPDHARLGTGHLAHRFREGEHAMLAIPMREQEARPAGIHDLADVRAGVTDARQHPFLG